MLSFSVNSTIEPNLTALLWRYVEKNAGMIRKAVSLSVPGYIQDRKGVIDTQVDILKEEVWFKTTHNFRVSLANPNFDYDEQVEHYVKSTIKNTLRDLSDSKKKSAVPVDLDLLDGHNNTSDDENVGDARALYQLFHTVANSPEHLESLEHNIKLDEFRKLVAEIYLTDKKLYDTLDELVQICCDNSISRIRIDNKIRYIRGKKEEKLILRFFDYFANASLPEIENIFNEFRKVTPAPMSKSKEIVIKDYPFYQYAEPDEIYRGVVKQGNKLAKFDFANCKFDSNVELETSLFSIVNPKTNKIYRIRIEDYLDYASYNTNVEEGVETELLHWFNDLYIYSLPSGKRVGFCNDPSEYMIMVKQELIVNLLKSGITNIFAMTDSYVYFSPRTKPKYSCVYGKLFNGKVIKMNVQEVYNVNGKG